MGLVFIYIYILCLRLNPNSKSLMLNVPKSGQSERVFIVSIESANVRHISRTIRPSRCHPMTTNITDLSLSLFANTSYSLVKTLANLFGRKIVNVTVTRQNSIELVKRHVWMFHDFLCGT